MSLVEETLNKAVRDVVNLIIGSSFAIKSKQNAPRPIAPHCVVDTTTITSVGTEELKIVDRDIDPDIDSTRSGYREIMFSLNFYFDNALDNAEQVRIGLTRNSILENLRAAKLGLGTRSVVRDLSETLENGWEERAHFDFILHAIGTDDDIITSIAAVLINGEFQTRGTSIPITIEA